jgi:hypothetical protein
MNDPSGVEPPLGSETNHAEECDRYDRILCGVAVTVLNAL